MHAVRKESSTTTKLRAVFDASAKSSTGVSLNDTLLVGPTVHPSLIDVLLRFRLHRIALTTDVSKMYRAVQLADEDRDLHRFVWKSSPDESLQDYRMTRCTFGVSASSFAAVRQNAVQLALKFPQVLRVVTNSFYVDDGLTGANTVPEAVSLQQQLQQAFAAGGFTLHKWNSSDPAVLQHISTELRDARTTQGISEFDSSTKALGLEWDVVSDCFHLTVAEWPPLDVVTKRALVSDIAKTFDVLGWFAPTIIRMKILLQRLWERRLGWDESIPQDIQDSWFQWRSQLPCLAKKGIPRCYFPKTSQIQSTQLHGFSDASEDAYSGVIYLRFVDSQDCVHVSLVMSKTRVAPIKRMSIPRLELCGAQLLADLLRHTREVFRLSTSQLFAWTDSTIVLNWFDGNPRRFKTFVGNRVSAILDSVPPNQWNHIAGVENPADCASRGISPAELLEHDLWWKGPPWLRLASDNWPKQGVPSCDSLPEEEREVCLTVVAQPKEPILPLNQYSSFTRLCRVTAWMFRFISNCRISHSTPTVRGSLTASEIHLAEQYWLKLAQADSFASDIAALKADRHVSSDSSLVSLRPFLDSAGVLRVGGRESNSTLAFAKVHPVILHGKHPVARLLISTEHLRLLHAGPTLLSASIGRRYHVIQLRKSVRSVTQQCIVCRRHATKPVPQMMGQLPMERITPGSVFQRVGVDYAGPFLIKTGKTRKPTILKSYACIFVSLVVKAVHIELVSDLTTEAFLATLRRFITRRGLPSLIWSDHGTNFVGAKRELKELYQFLQQQTPCKTLSDFCSSKGIEWRLIPEHGPHFGGLWEAAVKSAKKHLRRTIGDCKLTFEELTTVLAQIEACLNSRPLTPTTSADVDGIEVLTPGHFLIGQPLAALPDASFEDKSVSMLRRWQLCQGLVQKFWNRWSSEYLPILNRHTKWRHPTRNLSVGDIVLLKEDTMVPTKWPLGRVTHIHPGKDQLVRVVTIRTDKGSYKRPVTKLALLLPQEPEL